MKSYLKTLLQDCNLFFSEFNRALKLLKIYPLDTINSIISFLIVSVVFMIGINAIGDNTQIFGVFFFPVMLNLIAGPSESIRSDVEMGVFEQVYISKYSLIKVAVIRSIVAGLTSVIGSVLIAIILHMFFVKISIPVFHFILLFIVFSVQSLLIGVILAGVTLRFRKTGTLLNLINILLMVFLVLPLKLLSEISFFIPTIFCPFWGIVTYYQQLLQNTDSDKIYINLAFVLINTIILAFVAYKMYNKLISITKVKGYLGQY